MSRYERQLFERAVGMIRTDLGEDAYDVAFAEGRALSMEQTVEHALELSAKVWAPSR
jgi:hypothetical protein